MAEPYLGEIRVFAGNFAPRSYAFCAGQLLSIAQNDALYALLGTTYGGDGVNTFGLPDLRGRTPMGQGQGPGLTNRVIGEEAGVETVTLSTTQMPAHQHTLMAANTAATTALPAGGFLAVAGNEGLMYIDTLQAPGEVNATLPADSISVSGGSQPHDNLMPFLTVNYIIALAGIFPSQN